MVASSAETIGAFNTGFSSFEPVNLHHPTDGAGAEALAVVRHGVAAQVEIESKTSKQFITFQLQALKAGAFNRVARGKITECHSRALSRRPKAKHVLSRACEHGFQPALPCHDLQDPLGGFGAGVLQEPLGGGVAGLEPRHVAAQVEFESKA